MSSTSFAPGPTPNSVHSPDGKVLTAPKDWILLPPGDAALTRRVKAACDHWVVAEKKGRKVFSRGVWAPSKTIEEIRAVLEAERSAETYAKRKTSDAKRRETVQTEYVEDFHSPWFLFSHSIPNTRTLLRSPPKWSLPTLHPLVLEQWLGPREFLLSVVPKPP